MRDIAEVADILADPEPTIADGFYDCPGVYRYPADSRQYAIPSGNDVTHRTGWQDVCVVAQAAAAVVIVNAIKAASDALKDKVGFVFDTVIELAWRGSQKVTNQVLWPSSS